MGTKPGSRSDSNKVKVILKEAYNTAIKIIQDNKALHIQVAEDLLTKEEISGEEFQAYFVS
jgi:ATP-dependent Zn protease